MLRVSKCCIFFNLKYGFYTYAVISLIIRTCAMTCFYFNLFTILSPDHNLYLGLQFAMGGFVGWYGVTAAILCIVLKGIIQKRAILLYPYIVVLTVEIVASVILALYILYTLTDYKIGFYNYGVLWQLLISAGINIYATVCLVSLYRNFKDLEKRRPPPVNVQLIGSM